METPPDRRPATGRWPQRDEPQRNGPERDGPQRDPVSHPVRDAPAAVEAECAVGLPLSLAEREAAAEWILVSHPHWSDRAVAAVTGLAAGTVAVIRRRRSDGAPQPPVRIGRDGRTRPLNAAAGRRLAGDFIAGHPDASLREIARAAGISVGTARDVRARISRGEDPVPVGRRGASEPAGTDPAAGVPRSRHSGAGDSDADRHQPAVVRSECLRDPTVILDDLRRDPSLRFTDRGRRFLRWLDTWAAGPLGREAHLEQLPAHCAYAVAELARSCSQRWAEFADQLDRMTRVADDPPGRTPAQNERLNSFDRRNYEGHSLSK
ncbi:transcriptional regulator [Virgisporangium aurantiacum]|uniref:Homeodomain-like domain-containing protein n=1 Tax=Virgisporangium aurantiacum TaxID=175570 RepID=A0A8J3ZLF5_9ACTN|nr:transcriptional regulator [Virgisporangium aurantiacum]GIJ63653.1 hypothetical protein Vau01_111690 [Virgisporangium aurantiacum]